MTTSIFVYVYDKWDGALGGPVALNRLAALDGLLSPPERRFLPPLPEMKRLLAARDRFETERLCIILA